MTTEVLYCTLEDSVQKAAQIMKIADTGVVPIVDNEADPKVLGMVTDRDLCLSIVAEGKDPRAVNLQGFTSGRVIACYLEDDAQAAADSMGVYQVRRLPVLNNEDRLVGIVSIGDLSRERAIDPEDSGEVLTTISERAEDVPKETGAGKESR
jgi:CBS domain-containing protein